MSSKITNVAIAGATGSLGSEVLKGLLETKFTVTVIARKEGQKFPAGVSVKVVDTNSAAAIAEALRGNDAIVDTTSGPDPTLQGRIIEAAVSAGVYRIVMGEFSVDPEDPVARSPLFHHGKNQAYQHIKDLAAKGKITYTTISNGAFLDWNLRTGFINIDIRRKKVQYMNDGMIPLPWTMLSSISTAVANVLRKAEQTENRSFYISSVIKSQKQMVALAKETLGSDGWEESNQDLDSKLKAATEAMMAGKIDMEAIGDMIRWSAGTVPAPRWEQLDDNKLLGVERMNDDKVRRLIRDIASETPSVDAMTKALSGVNHPLGSGDGQNLFACLRPTFSAKAGKA
ncbi:isoflavone reductase family protein-like protein CipA [Alternaria rosae]|uniref:isoflavone reductase family protein-like protein CipA n=1 Tax=Alternaria rosae TaxID=1187941 RepID=UPI001E8EBC2A|nr:isoflavone reductase family protein-like protein CipA [Alternaria rosae]KAH6866459.1 isoflavone reductase family protein-like protein CipA [Alternaria rosae]